MPEQQHKPHPMALEVRDDNGRYWTWMERLRFDQVSVSPGSQRRLHESRVQQIASEFNARAALLIASYRPDGTYWRIGGQHCSHVIQDRGEKSWPWVVFSFNSEAQEIAVIEALNRYKAPAPADIIRHRLAREDPSVLQHLETLRAAGRNFAGERLQWCDLKSFETTKAIEALAGSRALLAELLFANALWPGQNEVRESNILWGVHWFLAECRTARGSLPIGSIKSALAGVTLKAIKDRARNYRGYETAGDRKRNGRVIARVMCDYYNERRPAGTSRLTPAETK